MNELEATQQTQPQPAPQTVEIKPVSNRALIRVDKIFFKDMMEINAKREELGKSRFSDRKLLEIVRRHSYWKAIMEDIINYDEE